MPLDETIDVDQAGHINDHETIHALLNALFGGTWGNARLDVTETTTSVSFADLATVGPAATVTIGASGKALVMVSTYVNLAAGCYGIASFAVSGATTRAAQDSEAVYLKWGAAAEATGTKVSVVSGLTPGSNTFTMKYRQFGGTGTFTYRQIVVIPL